jgi:hypothetical protein
MTTQPKDKVAKGAKKRVMPIPGKRQSFKKALEETHKQFGETLARLAK